MKIMSQALILAPILLCASAEMCWAGAQTLQTPLQTNAVAALSSEAHSTAALVQATAQTSDRPQVSVAVLSGEALFGSNSEDLSAGGVVALKKLIRELHGYMGILSIRITGHSDSIGAAAYNQSLSERRAQSVRRYFVDEFPDINIVAIGAGEDSPMASNTTAEGRKRNRRVEIQVVAKGVRP